MEEFGEFNVVISLADGDQLNLEILEPSVFLDISHILGGHQRIVSRTGIG